MLRETAEEREDRLEKHRKAVGRKGLLNSAKVKDKQKEYNTVDRISNKKKHRIQLRKESH